MQRRDVVAACVGIAAGALVPKAGIARPQGPVVMELFTSQGCSSCPPADRLLGEFAHDPSVIALAWHVDYWNGLGWADPFATRFATDRQRAYADRLGQEVYTPALVIGGAQMIVGSDRDAIGPAIAVSPAPSLPLAIIPDGDGLAVEIGGDGSARGLLAFYEPEHLTSVARGENGGRQLREYRIVRAAMPLEVNGAGRVRVPALPAGLGAVVLAQGADLRVLGAAELRPRAS